MWHDPDKIKKLREKWTGFDYQAWKKWFPQLEKKTAFPYLKRISAVLKKPLLNNLISDNVLQLTQKLKIEIEGLMELARIIGEHEHAEYLLEVRHYLLNTWDTALVSEKKEYYSEVFSTYIVEFAEKVILEQKELLVKLIAIRDLEGVTSTTAYKLLDIEQLINRLSVRIYTNEVMLGNFKSYSKENLNMELWIEVYTNFVAEISFNERLIEFCKNAVDLILKELYDPQILNTILYIFS